MTTFAITILIQAESREDAINRRCEGEFHAIGIWNAPFPPRTIAPEPWPLVLLPLKALAKEGDRGAGDIIARVVGPIGGDVFKSWYRTIFGKDCGCGNRQEALNARWPL